MKYSLAALTALWLGSQPLATAHHGFAPHYDRQQPVLIEGVIAEFQYVNPHSFVHVETRNPDGSTVTRWCEMQASSQLRIKGIGRDSLRVGDAIRIEGFQARRDPLGCEFATGYLADGSVLELRTSGGQSVFSAPRQLGESASIFGTWFRKSFPGAGSDPDPAEHYTPAGAAAAAANDQLVSNPVYQCSPVSPVRAWSQPGLPTEIRDAGDRVIVHHEFMDAERVIHLGMDAHPIDAPRTELGHSIGRWEGNDLSFTRRCFPRGSFGRTSCARRIWSSRSVFTSTRPTATSRSRGRRRIPSTTRARSRGRASWFARRFPSGVTTASPASATARRWTASWVSGERAPPRSALIPFDALAARCLGVVVPAKPERLFAQDVRLEASPGLDLEVVERPARGAQPVRNAGREVDERAGLDFLRIASTSTRPRPLKVM